MVAVGNSILTIVWNLPSDPDTRYQDLDAAVTGQRSAATGNQAGSGRAMEVGVPYPGQVTGLLRIQPGHQRGDVAAGRVVLAISPAITGTWPMTSCTWLGQGAW